MGILRTKLYRAFTRPPFFSSNIKEEKAVWQTLATREGYRTRSITFNKLGTIQAKLIAIRTGADINEVVQSLIHAHARTHAHTHTHTHTQIIYTGI